MSKAVIHVVKRLLYVPLSALVVSAAVFTGMHTKPGDPCASERRGLDSSYYTNCMHVLGLDRPLGVQYMSWLDQILHGVISPVLAGQALTSAWLGLFGILVAVALGVLAGTYSAAHQNTWRDRLASAGALVAMSTPNFVLASVLVIVTVSGFYYWSGGLFYESIGWGRLEQIPVPALAIGLPAAALIARHVRASMLEVLRVDYINAARAKGLTERLILYRHALRNSLIPVAGLLGPIATTIITGSVVVEYMFGIPGLGKALVGGLLGYNYLLPVTVMTYYTILIGVANAVTELLYVSLDPRIRY